MDLLLQMFPGLQVDSLNSVIIQGMNLKKKHEVCYESCYMFSGSEFTHE